MNTGNFAEVVVPEWCLAYLINGETEGYSEYELQQTRKFEESWKGMIPGDLNIGAFCLPKEGDEPSFMTQNDVTEHEACYCYTFIVPLL